MIAYYEVTEGLYNHLKADVDINTVKIGGNITDVNFNKQEIYPFGHLLISSCEFINGVVRFSLTVSVIDIVDKTKKDIRDENEKFKGIDNEQDVLNTMLAVLENLNRELKKGTFEDDGWELIGSTVAERVQEQFQDLAIGWQTTFTVDVPNNVQNCG